MRATIAFTVLAACVTTHPIAPQCTVIVLEHWHVTENDHSAIKSPGECGATEPHCRNVLEKRSFQRDGRCSDPEIAGVARLWCVDDNDDADHWSNTEGRNHFLWDVMVNLATPAALLVVGLGIFYAL